MVTYAAIQSPNIFTLFIYPLIILYRYPRMHHDITTCGLKAFFVNKKVIAGAIHITYK